MMEQQYKQDAFQLAAFVCGILSLVCIFSVFLAIGFGSLGVLFAILAKNEENPFGILGRCGTVFSALGLSVGGIILLATLCMLPFLFQNADFLEQLNESLTTFYGMDYTEYLETYF